ncbi:MAG TPA: NADP-dependent isocitrate dehydrogenase [Candidatus Margulisbacteria bacterium]|nr:MAG: isocitrate dehydrogenase (NADP(+)) [Candidatus Margulisbacteria bacterium GWD2_39_127]OGI06808.1 MAG: isocitrate dehydrogenase (NADP(+)) [Candidatus Margulisbacteria bacterium GWE2_39_32]HAR62155.1 NADP-dependent isocitrate dehydrogenase [Candidatus Margulisiibacteriota bacterium]HCT85969.1 NADP-dependent isocitrate dehydrogenase [Candidatus Margulisiibacteriota bacterium]
MSMFNYSYEKITLPEEGSKVNTKNGILSIPDNPIIPYIAGDGIGPDITKAMIAVVDAAVAKTYNGEKKIIWLEIFAGEKANKLYNGNYLPKDTLNALEEFAISIKGPLATPVGGGMRSLNVAIRQKLNLYACVRPVRYFTGVPAPVKHPEKMDVVIFRENTEDVYSGLEWEKDSKEAKKIIRFLDKEFGININADSGIGIKNISKTATEQLVRKAIKFAIEHNRKTVTIVHKGNIMKFTEGAFKEWGYELAKKEFADATITEAEVTSIYNGIAPEGKVIINDRIADNMFQQILIRTDEYDVLAMPNLNGDYLSDACAAQVGGLGMAPGANIGDYTAVFEATHGTAPKYAGLDKANPGSLILSAVMMLEYMAWDLAAQAINKAIEKTIQAKTVTYDLARQTEGAKELKTSEYAQAIIKNL